MKILKRETARKSSYFKREKVDVTELGEIPDGLTEPEKTYVWVTEVSAIVRDEIEQSTVIQGRKKISVNMEGLRALVAVHCCIDDDGNRIFEEDDVEWLMKKPASALGRIYDAYNRLNGISEEDREELEKNLKRKPARNPSGWRSM